jgi:hypothetical protein
MIRSGIFQLWKSIARLRVLENEQSVIFLRSKSSLAYEQPHTKQQGGLQNASASHDLTAAVYAKRTKKNNEIASRAG